MTHIGDTVPVHYRMLQDTCIALLPHEEANPRHILTYLMVGQHGEAPFVRMMRLKEATPDQYAALHVDITSIYARDGVSVRIVDASTCRSTWKQENERRQHRRQSAR